MAQKINEIDKILECVEKGDNFLLSGGAGSGKTYTLVHVLKGIFNKNSKARIACITYTNVAVREIKSRTAFENLYVSTIHDFLWDNIRFFQKELKLALVELVKEEKIVSSFKDNISLEHYNDITISYRDWRDIRNGVFTHDELIVMAEYMFKTYPRLCDILRDKFNCIFIDEYQDTFKEVVDIFLVHLKKSSKKNVIGFFGDSMQSIFDGVGSINEFVTSEDVKEVIKDNNRRNPESVIHLANLLRDDGVKQRPADDASSPNFNKVGSIKFIYSNNPDLQALKQSEIFKEWDFKNSKETKELYLTHNLIAPKAGFKNLMAIYDKDRIIEHKKKVLGKIKEDKIQIGEDSTFGQVLELVKVTESKPFKDFIKENNTLFEYSKKQPFSLFGKIFLDKDQLIGDKAKDEDDEETKPSKRDDLIKHLFEIQHCIYLFEKRFHNELIRKTKFKIKSTRDKDFLRETMKQLLAMKDKSIEEVVEFAHEKKIVPKDDKFNDFISSSEYVYNRVKILKWVEFCNLYDYLEGFTPFTTQHNIKGAEFKNVLVVLDNGRWNNYNFKELFLKGGSETVLNRTQKIFYVCCTRAMENLVVFYHNPEASVVEVAKKWFGEGNVVKLD